MSQEPRNYFCNPLLKINAFHLAEQELDRIMDLQNHMTIDWQMQQVLIASGFKEDLGAYDLLLRFRCALASINETGK